MSLYDVGRIIVHGRGYEVASISVTDWVQHLAGVMLRPHCRHKWPKSDFFVNMWPISDFYDSLNNINPFFSNLTRVTLVWGPRSDSGKYDLSLTGQVAFHWTSLSSKRDRRHNSMVEEAGPGKICVYFPEHSMLHVTSRLLLPMRATSELQTVLMVIAFKLKCEHPHTKNRIWAKNWNWALSPAVWT